MEFSCLPFVKVFDCQFEIRNGFVSALGVYPVGETENVSVSPMNSKRVSENVSDLDSESVSVVVKDLMWQDLWQVLLLLLLLLEA